MEKIRGLAPELYKLNQNLFGQPSPEAIPLRMISKRLETIRLAG